ncbi:MAG TPA: hypothetical protein VF519_03005 [Mycobacteriales bacterium]|jgi:hypothetical protein
MRYVLLAALLVPVRPAAAAPVCAWVAVSGAATAERGTECVEVPVATVCRWQVVGEGGDVVVRLEECLPG